MASINMPPLPVPQDRFIEYVAAHPSTPMPELLQPFKQHEDELRKVFAQHPEHAITKQLNLVPVFEGHEQYVKIRARDLTAEPDSLKEKYIMPLKPTERKPNGALAIADSMQHFKTNFNLFTESSLADLNWDNVVVAGSAVVTSLLSVPEQYSHSKRSLRRYYHEIVAPASDVDLFLYDLTEEQAVEKIKQIEKNVRDALLVETTTIRTKNTITIVSQYPVRHVQIVLRIYKSITEILTGFDVDCSCGAYDGKQVWTSPRAIASYMTQTNTIDLTRRSPSYENRLSKYRHRGFEVRFAELDRSRIDPTIYERSFFRTQGLARLLILEKLPKSSEREAYIDQRRLERGRPAADRSRMRQHFSHGDIKTKWEDEVAEWVDADELSSYHTFSIPYGPKYHARKIEKLLYTKDLLLNAEWNKPKDREVDLHRHPAFFGSADDVILDCCGHCPTPVTMEEEEVAEKESKIYVNGPVTFMKDDCGRQAIGSFNPLSPDEYTDMAYVGNTELLCQAVIDKDLHYVEQWLRQDGNDANTRDHTGRTPLHLAVSYSSLEVVQCLIDHGARLVARLVDGKTALHLACLRGDPSMVSALLRKSEANEEDDLKKTDERRKLRMEVKATGDAAPSTQDNTFELIDKPTSEMDIDTVTDGSMVHVKEPKADIEGNLDGDDSDSPDVYDVNVLTWDTPTSPLQLAIVSGHQSVVQCLVQDSGANILLPVILPAQYAGGPSKGALLTLTLAFTLPLEQAEDMTRLLFRLGASSAQADANRKTALEYCISNRPLLLETYLTSDPVGVARAIKHVSVQGTSYNSTASGPLLVAIENKDVDVALRLLSAGAKPDVPFEAYLKGIEKTANRSQFETSVEQPVVLAIENELPLLSDTLVKSHGVDSNTLTRRGWSCVHSTYSRGVNGGSLLDLVNDKIKNLREWKHKSRKSDPPVPLENDSFYLEGLTPGTYQHLYATKQIEIAKQQYEREWKCHVHDLSRIAHDETGLDEKQAAVYDKLDQFQQFRATLLAKSAKTFKELHPELEPREDDSHNMFYRYDDYPSRRSDPFKLVFGFNVAIPSDEVRMRYIRLFESAWNGDVKTIKELTLLAWTNSDGEKQPPLQIAVQDQQNNSPLSIVVLSGRLDLAKMILSIAAAQYTPPDPPKAQRYRVATNSDSDEDSNDSDDDGDESTDLPINSKVIDDNLTVEDIGEVSLSVTSSIKPEQMLHWRIRETDDASFKYTPSTLIEYALARGDMHLLTFLLDVFQEYTGQAEITDKTDDHQHFNFSKALLYGQPHMLAELIKRTAIGLSIDELALEHGVNDSTAAPKYYQGLSVHGKKRKDWAAAGRHSSGLEESGPQVPPLLRATYTGTLEQVEWMLSDAPLRCYKQFAQAHQADKRLQKISSVKGGFEGALRGFLHSRSHLAVHCCVARSDQTVGTSEVLKYLIEALPEAVEARSDDHLTPLLRAFQLHDLEAAKILIEAGADQTARDKDGMNLLHQLFVPMGHVGHAHQDVGHMRKMTEIIDKRLIPSMCLQRTSAEPGSLTPLALWFARLRGSRDFQANVTRLILEYGDGSELETLNGEGLTVLHTVAQMFSNGYEDPHQYLLHAKVLLERLPELVFWENATGKTSREMVEDRILALKCSGDEDSSMGGRHRYHNYSYGRTQSVTDKPPRDFIKQDPSGDVDVDSDSDTSQVNLSPKQHSEMMLKLLVSTQAKLEAEGRGKRRLVTLHEASEVARRLAATQRRKVETEDENVARRDGGYNSSVDQVGQWLSSARRYSGP
ncbi:hypothetical protein Q7P35_010943 [Cladosporium inversicolor]